MPDRSVTVVLKANTGQYTGALGQAQSATTRLGQTVEQQSAKAAKGFTGMSLSAGQMVKGLAFVGVLSSVGQLVTSFVQFDSAMSQVSAATMATSGDLAALRQTAIDAGQATKYSGTEAAQGITELAKAGVSTKDIIGGGLTGALNLAAAGQLEVADAAELSATALNVFGLSGSQMSHVADLLAAAAGKAQGSVKDMGMALNQSALVAKQTGLSIEDTTGSLALFASNGLTGSDAGTSFKNMLLALNPRSKEAAAAMDELGIRAYDSSGKFVGITQYAGLLKERLAGLSDAQRNATLQTIFGTDAIRAASILYEEGASGVQTWIDKTNDLGYASEQAHRLNDNLNGDLERFGGALETAFISGGGKANDSLRSLVQNLTDMVPAAANVVGGVFTLGGAVIGVAGQIVGALSPAISLVGGLASALGSLPGYALLGIGAFAGYFPLRERIGGVFSSITSSVQNFGGAVRTSWMDADTMSRQLQGSLTGMQLAALNAAAANQRLGDALGDGALALDPFEAAVYNANVANAQLAATMQGTSREAAAASVEVGTLSGSLSPMQQAMANAQVANMNLGDTLRSGNQYMSEFSARINDATAGMSPMAGAVARANMANAELGAAMKGSSASAAELASAATGVGTQVGFLGKAAGAAKAGLGTLRGALSSVVTAMGGATGILTGAAFAGVGAILGAVAAGQQKAAQRAAEHAAAVDQLAQAIHTANPEMADLVQMLSQQAVDSGLAGELDKIGVSMKTFAGALKGKKEDVQEIFNAIDTSGLAAEDKVVLMQKFADALNTLPEGKAKAELMKELGIETDATGDAMDQAADSTSSFGKSLGEAGAEAKSAADQVSAYKDALKELHDTQHGMEDATQSFNDATRDLATEWTDAASAAAKYGIEMVNGSGQINTFTAEGSKLKSTMDEVGESMMSAFDSTLDASLAAGKTLPEAYQDARAAATPFQDTLRGILSDLGLTDDTINAIVDNYTAIPNLDPTVLDVSVNKDAASQVQTIAETIAGLPPNTSVIVNGLTTDAVTKIEDLGGKVEELSDGTYIVTMDVQVAADVTAATDAEVQNIIDALDDVPAGKTVKFDAITQPAIDDLEDAGYTVTKLANGKYEVKLTADAKQALEEANSVQIAMGMVPKGTTVNFDISGDAAERLENMGFEVKKLDDGTYDVTVAADTTDASQDVQDLRTDAEGLTESPYDLSLSSNAPDVAGDMHNLRDAIGGVPTSHDTTTTSNAPEQAENFAALTTRIGGVPVSHDTTTSSNAEAQSLNFLGLRGSIFSVPGLISALVSSNAGDVQASLRALRDLLNAMNGMRSTVYVDEVRTGGAASRAATGGLIAGPGTSTSDSIPTMLSNGEFVMRAAAVAQYGLAFMNMINQGRLPGLANGGQPVLASLRAGAPVMDRSPVMVSIPAPAKAGDVNITNNVITPPDADPSRIAATVSHRLSWEMVTR